MEIDREALRLLDMASRDLRAAEGMVDDVDTFTDEIVGFHAQQAVEKTVKGWLCFLGATYPKTHDLDELFEILNDSGITIPHPFMALRDLVDFAVQYRYEAFDGPLGLDREATVAMVRQLHRYVQSIMASGCT